MSEPSLKDNKPSSLITEESPPVLSPQKYNPHFPAFNKGPDIVTQSKSLSKEDRLRNYTFSSSSSTVAAADSSSSHNPKNCDATDTTPIQINSSDSDLSLPSLDGDPAEELDISAVVFHTTPLKSVARTGQMPFTTSAVNGSVDSDSDLESLSITSSQAVSRPKRSCTVVKTSGKVKSGSQVNRLDKQKRKSVHVMKKRKGLGE